MERDMTKGSPLKHIVLFTIPVFLGNLFQQFYNIIDAIIVGRLLGENALAAVGCTGSIMFLVVGFALGMTQGFGIGISRAYGQKDFKRLKHLVFVTLVLGGLIAATLTLVATGFSYRILALMNTPENIIDLANSYIVIIYLGMLPLIYYNIAGAILRGIGDSRTPLYFLIVSSLLNILFDYSFITFFHMSVNGAALATVTAQGIAMVMVFIYMFSRFEILKFKREHCYLDWESVSFLMKIGIPMALNFSVISVGFMILQSAVNSFGSSAVAAFTGASRVENIIIQVLPALGAGVATYCGQNYGAGEYQRIIKGVNQAAVFSVILAVLAMILLTLFGESVVRLFLQNPSEQVIEYANRYLENIRYMLPLLGLLFVYRSSLQAMDMQFIPLLSGILELLARFVVCGLLLNQLGYLAIPYGEVGSWILASSILAIAYISWYRKNYQLELCEDKI